MYAAFPRSDYYGSSVPSRGRQTTTVLPPTGLDFRPVGRPRMVPRFTAHRFSDEVPDSAPAASPVVRRRLSHWPPSRRMRHGYGVDHPQSIVEATRCSQPISTRLELVHRLRGVKHRFLSYTFPRCLPGPACLVVPDRPVVVRTAPTLTGVSRIGLSSASPASCDWPVEGLFHPLPVLHPSTARCRFRTTALPGAPPRR